MLPAYPKPHIVRLRRRWVLTGQYIRREACALFSPIHEAETIRELSAKVEASEPWWKKRLHWLIR
jgi:hypothetical protein